MSLDLGGIGKGFAADEALALLKSRGFPRALVELGGDFAIGDAPRGEAGWRVGRDGDASPLVLRNCGVATSGAAFRSFEANGARRSHVLNPKEGFGLEGEEATTVVAPDGATADALATALSVLPLERRSEVLRRFGARVE